MLAKTACYFYWSSLPRSRRRTPNALTASYSSLCHPSPKARTSAKLSAPPASRSTLNLSGGNYNQHFGYFPRSETRPGAIVPAYGNSRLYQSDRNIAASDNEYRNRKNTNGIYYTLPRQPRGKTRKLSGNIEETKGMENSWHVIDFLLLLKDVEDVFPVSESVNKLIKRGKFQLMKNVG